MSLNEKDLLRKLVSIPSVNPALVGESQEIGDEADLTDFLQNVLQKNRWPWLRQTVHQGRDNLVAVVRGAEPAAILWEAHQDTVGTEGMRIEPFAAESRDGRIWGRGACDVKGGMAAMLAALEQTQQRLRSTVVLAFTINEECGFTGARSLGRLWSSDESDAAAVGETRGPLSLTELRSLRPQRAIVAEPTMLNVVIAHKGVVRWRCRAHGRAAHSSQPEQGVNAVYAMAQVVSSIDHFGRDVLSQRRGNKLCGGPTVCVSTIRGGSGVNTVPDEVVVDIDRRVAPGEQTNETYQELIDYVAEHADYGQATIEHEIPWLESPGLNDRENQQWGQQLVEVVRSTGVASELVGVPYCTDAPAIAACGIPTIVFGPGSIDQAHTVDEWLDLNQLSRAVEVFSRLACEKLA